RCGGRGSEESFFSFVGSLFFCKNNWKLDFFLEDLKAFRARGSCPGSALNFWAPGRFWWNAARGLALVAFTDIVAKIAICIIRILLNFIRCFFHPVIAGRAVYISIKNRMAIFLMPATFPNPKFLTKKPPDPDGQGGFSKN
ncbi:hypothetical protein, partial [Dialister sp.]|uniref:hypothetical protein n=1 Tax=Dialister sp. TaxID=1955814 RepID=UPI002E823D51